MQEWKRSTATSEPEVTSGGIADVAQTEDSNAPALAGPMVVGQPAAERLLQQVRQQARIHAEVSSAQVVTVLRALADYTHMEAAARWRQDERDGSPAFSVAAWMHAVADQIEQMHGVDARHE